MAWGTLFNWTYDLENIVQLGIWLGEHCSIRLMAWRTLFNWTNGLENIVQLD